MELIEGKDLSAIIREPDYTTPTRHEIISTMYKLMTVLNKIHSKGFAHRDIKPHNIMMKNSNKMPVLIDFGLMCKASNKTPTLYANTLCTTIIGTYVYMSPILQHWYQTSQRQGGELSVSQIFRMTPSIIPGDIYSMGMTFYQMINPFMDPYDSKGNYRPLNDVDIDISEIIFNMLDKDDKNRPTSAEVLLMVEKLED